MPELPEVETTRRALAPHVCGQFIQAVCIRNPRLRQPVPPFLAEILPRQQVHALERRAKYLLFACDQGHLLVHLGMSGSLRLAERAELPQKHDHIDLLFDNGALLRYRDPRRFGLFLWCQDPHQHPLLATLGPEPLTAGFNGAYLYARAQGRRQAIKTFLMDNHIVVGVGNIYASESLFLAGIDPVRAAGRISLARYETLAQAVKEVLHAAIAQGGTTLRDFVSGVSQPGYFAQSLRVYQRDGYPCLHCGAPIQRRVIGQRASYYCPHCQR
jgi:formamidopyrimidine-DNA glycosylase